MRDCHRSTLHGVVGGSSILTGSSLITSLERAGVSPRTTQTLARHSDIRLTMGICTHIELGDQAAAIGALPGPPGA